MEPHMAALAKANTIRVGRASLRKQVGRGNVELACELLLARDARIESMPIGEFIEWLPRVGPTRAEDILQRAFTAARGSVYAPSAAGRLVRTLGVQLCLLLTAEMRSATGVA